MEVAQLSEGLVRLTKGENTYLGVVTYLRSNSFAVTKLTAQRRSNGYIARESGIEPWKPLGFTEHDGRVYFYGPFTPGRTLSEIIRLEPDSVLPYLSRLARALAQLQAAHYDPPIMHTRAIVFLDDGGILFLPYEIMSTIKDHQTLSDRIEFHDLYNHPDLEPDKNLSFALAVLVYHALTGEYPFDAESDDELRNKMRNQVVTRPIHRVPEIRPEVSDFLTRLLADPEHNSISLEAWSATFEDWMRQGTHREVSEEERIEIQAQAETVQRSMEKTYRRREFVRQNWKRIVVIGLIVVLVGTIPGTILYNKLQPRAIAGLPPEEVIRTFYNSMNGFDHLTMEDCVTDNAARAMIREVTNLYVMSRMRMSVEMQSGFIDAHQWRQQGMPEIPQDRTVYGTANVRVAFERSLSENERVFRAQYEKWQPHFERNEEDEIVETSGPSVVAFDRIDRLYLRREGDAWVIYRLERVQDKRLSLAQLREQES